MKLRKFISVTTLLIAAVSSVYAQNRPNPCPTLTREDIENTINNGSIQTQQDRPLAVEIDKTRPQVLIDEPTANPFDTYFIMHGIKEIGDQEFIISINRVLGKDIHEAKDRTTRILLGNQETSFEGIFDHQRKECIYKAIDAAEAIPNFPFKTRTEHVELTADLWE